MRLPLTVITLMGSMALFAIASCDEESALDRLGDGCLLNSDCEAGLVCVFERCHIACNSSIDCPLASDGTQLRCVLGEKPSHVCQLESERDCAYHSECPGAQICGPDGQCRDECLDDRDCVAGQICLAEGVCADEAELENGALPRQAPPDGQTGFPCAYDSQCVDVGPVGGPTFVCKNGGCNYACYDTIDCAPTFLCFPDDGDASTPGDCVPGPDTINCIPGEQKACDCWPPETGGPGVQVCAPDGQGFLPCQSDQNPDCGNVP
jgi:hypothetical protein